MHRSSYPKHVQSRAVADTAGHATLRLRSAQREQVHSLDCYGRQTEFHMAHQSA
jgi:hypothetical protein